MAKNIKNITIGAGLIVLAIICGITSFYFLEVNPELTRREQARLRQEAELKAAAQEEAISLKAVLKQSEKIYPPQETGRKEGVMWFDRKASRFVVTLGAINGLSKGSVLSVYDGDDKIAEVKVESALDAISYVNPDESSKSFLKHS